MTKTKFTIGILMTVLAVFNMAWAVYMGIEGRWDLANNSLLWTIVLFLQVNNLKETKLDIRLVYDKNP